MPGFADNNDSEVPLCDSKPEERERLVVNETGASPNLFLHGEIIFFVSNFVKEYFNSRKRNVSSDSLPAADGIFCRTLPRN